MALATNDLGQVGGLISPGFSMMADVFISIILATFLVLGVLQAPQLLIMSIPFLIVYLWAVFSYNKKMAPISHTFMRKWSAIATAVPFANAFLILKLKPPSLFSRLPLT